MFSQKALDLILEFEGMDQPSGWPGGDSGVSIGIGYDLGYEGNFEEDWSPYLSQEQIDRLKTAIGLTGQRAKEKAKEFKDIRIKYSDAVEVFKTVTICREIEKTRSTFPGFDELPEDAQGALVSLVYNRGTAMSDDSQEDRRREMRAIKEIIPDYLYDKEGVLREIAKQLKSMERLWIGRFAGLVRRREAEAKLVESCI